MVVSHVKSVEVFKVNSDSIFEEIERLFESNDIPWKNLVSVLMDSCSVMRGSKNGVEAKVREKAPHLLDIDGDSCHHIHNCCRVFCKQFDYWVEGLFGDLHTDFKWSSDLKEAIAEMCVLLGVKYTVQERFVPHRWLSAYDLAVSNVRLLEVLKVFYFSFLSKDDKETYSDVIVSIFTKRKISTEARCRIRELQREMMRKQKGMTTKGKTRMNRIINKILFESLKTDLQLNFYVASLSLLKAYVMVFQAKDTLVHQLHCQQMSIFRQFLGNFIKAEIINEKKPKQLKQMELGEDQGQYLDLQDMFVGSHVDKLVKQIGTKDKIVIDFQKQVAAAYKNCGQYMQKKLPLQNAVLTAMTSVDPEIHGHSVAAKEMKVLVGHFKHILTEEEQDEVIEEIRNFHVDDNLPTYDDKTGVVDWWARVGTKK